MKRASKTKLLSDPAALTPCQPDVGRWMRCVMGVQTCCFKCNVVTGYSIREIEVLMFPALAH